MRRHVANQAGEVLVAVTGGIAAYKVCQLVSRMAQADIGVSVMMTRAAREFVGPATFAALSGRPVASESFDPHWPLGPHIELTRGIDLMVVAPASADFLGKAAHGLADDLVSTAYLARTCPIMVAPAMNHQMWSQAAVQRNVARLRDDGVLFAEPAEGWQACREQGSGRMAEPDELLTMIQRLLSASR